MEDRFAEPSQEKPTCDLVNELSQREGVLRPRRSLPASKPSSRFRGPQKCLSSSTSPRAYG